jgi:hypothetical protein
VGANGINAAGLFDTSAGVTGVTEAGMGIILGGAGTIPNYVAASPDGLAVFIADPTNHQLMLRDTVTGSTTTATASQGLDTAAGDTHAIAVGQQFVPTIGVSPDARECYCRQPGLRQPPDR